MEKRVDIIPFLEGVVAENTQHYQLDLMFDAQRFEKAMLEPSQEDRTFLWMSRPSGTWCFLEREVFLRETPAHTTWTYRDYAADAAHIKAFRVILAPGRPGALVLGRIQPLNYGEQVQRVKQNALHVQTVEMTAGNGETYAANIADCFPPMGSSKKFIISRKTKQSCPTSSRRSGSFPPPGDGAAAPGSRRPGRTPPPAPLAALF